MPKAIAINSFHAIRPVGIFFAPRLAEVCVAVGVEPAREALPGCATQRQVGIPQRALNRFEPDRVQIVSHYQSIAVENLFGDAV